MRYGYNKKHIKKYCESIGFEVRQIQSKPPRLIVFKNKSYYTAGVLGMTWQMLDMLNSVFDERAWVQMVFKK